MRLLFAAALLATGTVASSALAEDGCPPGSWFCESVENDERSEEEEAGAGDDFDDEEAPRESQPQPRKKRGGRVPSATEPEPKTVEVDSEGGDTVVIVKGDKKEKRPGKARKRNRERRWRETFGLNLRVEGAIIPSEFEAGMGGVGLSFRFRPSPYFALDLGSDLLGGTDSFGDARVEVAASASGLVYFNPQHRVQVYGIAGLNAAYAEVEDDVSLLTVSGDGTSRSYIGGHAGLGLEVRLSRHFGLFGDGVALLRQRVDSEVPEYVDPESGATSNLSAAGLVRTGVNFWW